jgi:GTP-sensing pleiotropic transcriptional regulator CodY
MKELSKEEKKLLKQMKKLKKISDKYISQLTEVDEKLRELSIRTSLAYNLEKDYFDKAPTLIRAIIPMQVVAGALTEVLTEEGSEQS